jgi:hypothetical protein
MKLLRTTGLVIGVILSLLVGQGMALSTDQSGNKGETPGAKGSSKSLAQTIEEIRNSINEAWHKLTDPKTVQPARDSVNEGWRKLTSPNTTAPARDEINKAWKGLSDAAGAAGGSKETSRKDGKETRNR